MKENKAVFLEQHCWRHKIVAVGILFGFCFRLDTFTSEISNLLLPLVAVGWGAVNLNIPCFSLLLLLAFELKHNTDEKYVKY